MIIDVDQIRWAGGDAHGWLVRGEVTEQEAEDAVRAFFVFNPGFPLTVGPLDRFRRRPGQWGMETWRNTSKSLKGTFIGRSVR